MVYSLQSGSVAEARAIMRKRRSAGILPAGPGKWRVTARIRQGSRILTKQTTIAGTVEEAKSLFERLKTGLREGDAAGSLTSPVETFGQVLELYAEKKGPFCRSHMHTVELLRAGLGNVPPDLFADRFEGYLRLVRQTRTRRGELPSGHTLNRRIEIAKAAFNVAVACGCLARNPVTQARFPEAKEIPRDVTVTQDDRAGLVEIARQSPRTAHIADALNFALQVPIRKGELVNMRVVDVDLFSNAVRVRNGTTKNDQGTYKPIPPDMRDFFKARVRQARSPEEPVFCRVIAGDRKRREDCGGARRVVGLGDFKNAWETVRTAAKLPDLRIHDTRHVSATAMVDAGTPEQVVMSVANWKTNMLRTYYHRDPKKSLELVRFRTECEGPVKASIGVER